MQTRNPKLLVLYGSQTGTAKDVAEELWREGRKRCFDTQILDLADFEVTLLPSQPLVLFVCSTTGQGEVPDHMKFFWKFLLQRNLPPTSLQSVKFAVFGLGDSSYVKYNFVSKMLINRLQQLGGTSLLRRGDGNDQHPQGLYGDFFPWSQELWSKLSIINPLPLDKQTESGALPPPRYKIVLSSTVSNEEPQSHPFVDDDEYVQASVETNQRLTSPEWEQDVRHISLAIPPQITYQSGDVVYVRPENSSKGVLQFLSHVKLNPQQQISAIIPTSTADKPLPLRFPITIYQLFSCYLDVMGTPKRYFFELLSYFATEERERDQLLFFSTAAGYQQLYEYNQKSKRSYLDVLTDFGSCSPPLDYWLELISVLQPRPFSISSSPTADPNQIHISMVVVKYKSPISRIKNGVCSTWLSSFSPSPENKVSITVKKGTVTFPHSDPTRPVIMVGPGTGCAMFRSFIRTRANLMKQPESKGQSFGPLYFFFGCRKEQCDFLYGPEWLDHSKSGVIHLHVAFSRDHTSKSYVTHKILAVGSELWNLISNHEALIYVSGNASNNMPRDVLQAFVDITVEHGKKTSDQAKDYFRVLERQNRYMVETWF